MSSEGQMWVEKYRPHEIRDLIGQSNVVTRLDSLLENPKEMPHLLFSGPPGTGKTSAALIVAQKILGEPWRDYTLEMNASDERGIGDVRDKVKIFSRHLAMNAPYRIIILDEADEMTNSAQTALRRIMEESSRFTRFIMVCNYSSGIIEPLQSRCAIIRFPRLPKEEVVSRLEKICRDESLQCDEAGLSKIYDISNGDMRQAINLLQGASLLDKIDAETIERVSGITHKGKVGEIINLALDGQFSKARSELIQLTKVQGLSEADFIKYAGDELFRIDDPNLGEIAKLISEYDYRLVRGANPDIQMAALLAHLGSLGGSSKKLEIGHAKDQSEP